MIELTNNKLLISEIRHQSKQSTILQVIEEQPTTLRGTVVKIGPGTVSEDIKVGNIVNWSPMSKTDNIIRLDGQEYHIIDYSDLLWVEE